MLAGIRDVAPNLMLRNLKELKSEAQMRQNQWEKFLQNRHMQAFRVLLRNQPASFARISEESKEPLYSVSTFSLDLRVCQMATWSTKWKCVDEAKRRWHVAQGAKYRKSCLTTLINNACSILPKAAKGDEDEIFTHGIVLAESTSHIEVSWAESIRVF